MPSTYTRRKSNPAQAATSSQQGLVNIESDNIEWDQTFAPLAFTPGPDGDSVLPIATDEALRELVDLVPTMATQTTMAALLAAFSSGTAKVQTNAAGGTPVPPLQVLTLGAAQSLVPPTGATSCQIGVNGGDMRYRDDGTPASPTSGLVLQDGVIFRPNVDTLTLVSIALDSASSAATATVAYYR